MFKLIAFFSFSLLLNFNSNASFFSSYKPEHRLGLYKSENYDTTKVTHVIIVGSAVKEDSNQFFQSGVTKAQKYNELYPNDQVVIISSPEVVKKDDDEVFAEFNINVIKTEKGTLNPEMLFEELYQLDQIASIDYFGHSSPWALKLGKENAALNPSVYTQKLLKLKSHLTKNAYMTLSSCNSGFTIAPEFSKVLEIPVAGSLTSSLFERIESDGHWYKEEDSNSSMYVESNNFSFQNDSLCKLGLCVRMKTARVNYSAYWGNFEQGGLSFYKFFCNFENSNNKCQKAMALSVISFPSVRSISLKPTLEEYQSVVFDWLCSTGQSESYFQNCVSGIKNAVARGDLVYQSHPSNELFCTFKSCQGEIVCKNKRFFGKGIKGGSCKLITPTNDAPTNVATEYLELMKGFELL